MLVSPNFGFLAVHDPQLVRLGALAERYFTNDPNTCVIKLRQFGELLAQLIAAQVGIYVRLDHFDAVKIGLTATLALHTTQIFGEPVYTYRYKEAVIDGHLIDCEPPIRIVTALLEDGMVWQPGAEMEYFDPLTGTIDLINAPDEVKIEIEPGRPHHVNKTIRFSIDSKIISLIRAY